MAASPNFVWLALAVTIGSAAVALLFTEGFRNRRGLSSKVGYFGAAFILQLEVVWLLSYVMAQQTTLAAG
jgi:hypothetical protein